MGTIGAICSPVEKEQELVCWYRAKYSGETPCARRAEKYGSFQMQIREYCGSRKMEKNMNLFLHQKKIDSSYQFRVKIIL